MSAEPPPVHDATTSAPPETSPVDPAGVGPAAFGYPPTPGYATAPGSTPPGYGPPPGYAYPGGPAPAAPDGSSGGRLGRLGRNAGLGWSVAGLLGLAVIGLSLALATRSTSPARAASPSGGASTPGASVPGGGGAGRFGGGLFGGANGVVGTVSSVSAKSFVVQDRAGTSVTVDEQSSTTYSSGTSSATSSVVVTGARVAVQGTRSANTVTATRVIVLPAGGFGGFGGGGGSGGFGGATGGT